MTEDNKMEYIQLVAQYRLQESVKEEIDCFVKGLHSIVDDGLISIFDENELEVCEIWSIFWKRSSLTKAEALHLKKFPNKFFSSEFH